MHTRLSGLIPAIHGGCAHDLKGTSKKASELMDLITAKIEESDPAEHAPLCAALAWLEQIIWNCDMGRAAIMQAEKALLLENFGFAHEHVASPAHGFNDLARA